MQENNLISGTTCHKCSQGIYHFLELYINENKEPYLRYKCDKCGHTCIRKYNVNIEKEGNKNV